MTEWHPRRETGLLGARYPEEELEPHTPEGRSLKTPGVYIIKCSQPSDWDTVEKRWDANFDADMPDFIETAFDAQGILYVGSSNDVLSRLHEHLNNPNKTASILKVYPIHSVWGVEWFDDEEIARERESGIALRLDRDIPGYYVHQR